MTCCDEPSIIEYSTETICENCGLVHENYNFANISETTSYNDTYNIQKQTDLTIWVQELLKDTSLIIKTMDILNKYDANTSVKKVMTYMINNIPLPQDYTTNISQAKKLLREGNNGTNKLTGDLADILFLYCLNNDIMNTNSNKIIKNVCFYAINKYYNKEMYPLTEAVSINTIKRLYHKHKEGLNSIMETEVYR